MSRFESAPLLSTAILINNEDLKLWSNTCAMLRIISRFLNSQNKSIIIPRHSGVRFRTMRLLLL